MALRQDVQYPFGTQVPFQVALSPQLPTSGWTVKFVIFAPNAPSVPLVTKATGSGVVNTDPNNGVWSVALAQSDTNGVAPGVGPGVYYYEFARVDSGAQDLLAYGTFTVFWPRPL